MSGEQEVISGELSADEGRIVVRLERLTEHPPEKVWGMLTDSVDLARWLAPGTLEARPGGRVQLDFGNSGTPIDCKITECEQNRLLAYSWGSDGAPERPLSWELEPTEDGTRLALTLSLPEDELVPIACAGWDAHLEMLMAALEGISIHFPAERFRLARSWFETQVREQLAA